jgi:hypothetical protein
MVCKFAGFLMICDTIFKFHTKIINVISKNDVILNLEENCELKSLNIFEKFSQIIDSPIFLVPLDLMIVANLNSSKQIIESIIQLFPTHVKFYGISF